MLYAQKVTDCDLVVHLRLVFKTEGARLVPVGHCGLSGFLFHMNIVVEGRRPLCLDLVVELLSDHMAAMPAGCWEVLRDLRKVSVGRSLSVDTTFGCTVLRTLAHLHFSLIVQSVLLLSVTTLRSQRLLEVKDR